MSTAGAVRSRAAMLGRPVWMIAVVSIAGALVVWQIAADIFDSVLFPSVTETARALVGLVAGPDLRGHAGLTMMRVFAGFAIGSTAGVALGLATGAVRPVRRFFEPYVNFFRFVTPIAWIAPATIWFGVGETTRLFLVVYATIFIVTINTMAAFAHVGRDKVRMARMLGASRVQVFRDITLPVTIPFILVGMRIGMGNSFMTVIAAEMLAGQNGLGYLVYSSRIFFKADLMFAVILILGVLGYATDRLFARVQSKAFGRFATVR